MNIGKSVFIRIFLSGITLTQAICARDSSARTPDRVISITRNHALSDPKTNTQNTSKNKKSKVAPKTKHTQHSSSDKKTDPESEKQNSFTQRTRAQINRWYKHAVKLLWGTGSFKEHRARRLTTLLATIIAVGAGVNIVLGDYHNPIDASIKAPKNNNGQKDTHENLYDGCELIENQFVYAAYKGDKAKVEELLRKGVDVNTVATSKYIRLNKQTALHVASNEGHLDIMNLLLTHKANVNTYDSVNRTPLHNAAFWYRTDAINILLQAKADVNARDMWGSTPLLRANGDRNTVAALLEANANVTIANNYGFLPLHSAVAALRHEGVQLLLIQNPDTIKKLDNTGSAVLHIAVDGDSATEHSKVRDEKHTMVELLLRHNANPNLKNYSGQTAYDMAEHQETKTLLLSRMTQKR